MKKHRRFRGVPLPPAPNSSPRTPTKRPVKGNVPETGEKEASLQGYIRMLPKVEKSSKRVGHRGAGKSLQSVAESRCLWIRLHSTRSLRKSAVPTTDLTYSRLPLLRSRLVRAQITDESLVGALGDGGNDPEKVEAEAERFRKLADEIRAEMEE